VITLVLGGVRSGKSEVAEHLVGPGPVTYVATGLVTDDDFAARVARHRARRPAAWTTVEEPRAVPQALARIHGPVLLDALGTWIANDSGADLDALVAALTSRPGDTVVVSEEVGLGVHPVTEVGRAFADTLGEANRRVAEVADRCLLVVAGRVVELPAGGPGRPVPPAPAREAGGLRTALAFLTPLGGAALPGPGALTWFPVAGALLGLVLGAVWWLAEDLLGPLAGAAVVVVADLFLTGALHFDGLVDSADGLLPHLPPERRLAVMAEPGVGAFGIAAGTSAVVLRTAALASLGDPRPLLLGALWTASRTLMAVVVRSMPYARSDGLASAFRAEGADPRGVGLGGLALAIALAMADHPATAGSVIVCVVSGGAVHRLARRRIGGFTGDVLGAGALTGETVGLLVAAGAGL
jgi:cobalamin 5'-phosphate synthase/cobalamin synthase